VVAGEGRRLFDGSVPLTRLALLGAHQTAAGNVVQRYALRPQE
jgi:RNA polymerase sigma-70 factor (ECF subfamily)